MRHLVLLRGPQGAGKSQFIIQNGLEQYTISSDKIRLLFQSPVMNEEGNYVISQSNDKKVWGLLFELLEERMKRGEFTIIDATHVKNSAINQYKELATKYRYRVTVVDFSDVSLETLLERNKNREEHKRVPEHVISTAYMRAKNEKLPSWVNVIKPEDFMKELQFNIVDFSHWKKIHHIGDIHGCYDVLMKYLKDGLKDDELYIFVGDLLDRGIQNAEVLKFFIEIKNKPNVIILEGNHEIHFWRWANDEEVTSRVFINETQPQLEKANISKKEVRQLYRKLRQIVYYKYHDKTVVVTHGGIPKIPENFMFMATNQFIKGVGDYNLDIDYVWDTNTSEEVYQIHGHRNIYRLPVRASKRSFNLEGQVEFGGHLRVVTLSEKGFETFEIQNDVFKVRQNEPPKFIKEEYLTMDDFLNYLRNHEYIREKQLGDNISSFNFTKKAFNKDIWDDINVKARGLFINTNTKEIVARSYNKFFNINERPSTAISNLVNQFKFPVSIYNKPNGYLGIVGYNSEKDQLVFTSKSEISTINEFAQWFKELFYKIVDEHKIEKIKKYVKEHNVSLIFEVILPEKDPHIIEYEKDEIILLDIVKRELVYSKLPYSDVVSFAQQYGFNCKKLMFQINNWIDFYKWYCERVNNWLIKEEGYVIEDSNGFMVKLKLPYYSFWKQMRSLKDRIAKTELNLLDITLSNNQLYNKFILWAIGQNKEWLLKTDIISIRKRFIVENNIDEDYFLKQMSK